jgi:hypothetical protein
MFAGIGKLECDAIFCSSSTCRRRGLAIRNMPSLISGSDERDSPACNVLLVRPDDPGDGVGDSGRADAALWREYI